MILRLILGTLMLNAQIEVEDFMKDVAGKYTIHDTSNENGQMLGCFTTRNKLKIKRTCLPHKVIHLGTWKAPDNINVNQIDHILVDARHASSVMDVRSCRGSNCDSENFLLKTKIRGKLCKKYERKKAAINKWNTAKLKDVETRALYSQ
jgi:hypothetical protein